MDPSPAAPPTEPDLSPVDRDGGPAAWLVPVMLLTLTVGIVRQGGTSPEGPGVLAVGLLATTAMAAAGQGPRTLARRLGSVTVVPLLLLGAWALLDAALHGSAGAGTATAAEAVGVAAVLVVVRGLTPSDRAMLRDGLVLVGALVGALTWLGAVLRLPDWAATGRGLWRADGPLTYANATAAVLVVLGLVALGGVLEASASGLMPAWGYLPSAALMFGAAAATLSRGGALALVAGSLVLVGLAGRTTVRPLLTAAAGGAPIVVGLVPGMPAAAAPQPVSALLGLVAGLLVTVVLDRMAIDRGGARPAAWARPAVVVSALLTAALVALTASGAFDTLGRGRLTLDTTHRGSAAAAAWSALDGHLLTGLGPGASSVHWRDPDGASMTLAYLHDEYLQVLLELGVVGALLLAWWLLGSASAVGRHLRLLRRLGLVEGETPGAGATFAAALTAFAVHSGVDFLWHLPGLTLMAATLVGLASPNPCPASADHDTMPAPGVPTSTRGKPTTKERTS